MLFFEVVKLYMILLQDLDIDLISNIDLIFQILFFEDVKLHMIIFQDLDINLISNMDLIFGYYF